MANPQIDNGNYTRISNEILEALAGIRISGEAWQVLNVIFRKTYGYQKVEDAIALSQFCLATKMSKPRVCQAIVKLIEMHIITKKGNAVANVYRINKDFDTWKPLPKKVTITKKGNEHYQKRKKSLPKNGHTKKKKENTTKDTPAKIAGDSPKDKKQDDTSMSLSEFTTSCRASPNRHIQIIAEYADEKKLSFTTKGQWREFITRNVRPARRLSAYNNIQIADAMKRIEQARKTEKNERGYITKWTLETLEKFLDN